MKRPLEHWKKVFILIYTGQAFSLVGSSAVQFSIIWWLTVNTGSALTLTTAAIVGFLPNILVGPFAGVWIDRYNRKLIMMLADGFVAVSSAALAISFLFGTPSVPFIYAVLFMRGLGGTFHSPAMQAAIPMLVPEEQLVKANGWGQFINSACNMAGPVLGAAMMGMFSLSWIMLVDIFGAAMAITTLLFVKVPDVQNRTEKLHMLGDLKQGLHAILSNRPLIVISVPVLVSCVMYMPLNALFPLLIRSHFGGTEWHTSLAELLFALGLLAASAVLGMFGKNRRQFFLISLSLMGLGVAVALSGLLPSGWFLGFAALAFVMGCMGTFFSTPYMAYIQRSVDPAVMGKVISLGVSLMGLAMPIGLLAAGPGSELMGVDGWFVLSGVLLTLVGGASLLLTRRFDLSKERLAQPSVKTK